jgi:hypothetical protein
MDPSKILSEQNLERIFLTSAFLGIGAIALPVLAPIAIGGMVGSQTLFWGRVLTERQNKEADD